MQLSQNKIYLIFILSGFLLYGNTLGHDYALDDAIVIEDNQFTKKGLSGIWDQLSNDQFMGFYGEKKSLVSGGRYRPLSMVMFNIEYALFGANPRVGHLMNILWYIFNGILLFVVLKRLLPENKSDKQLIPIGLTVSLLWFFHPIHTEVVANIKGRDEIMAFCGLLCTLLLILNYLKSKSRLLLIGVGVAYFLSLLAKENAITWLVLFPAATYFFKKNQLKNALPAFAITLIAAGLWLWVRYLVVGEGISNVADNLMNDPFLESTKSEKYATIFYTLGKYLQLLVFPHPLTFDYYPKHIPILNWSNPKVIFSVVIYIFLFIVALKGFLKRRLIAFGIILYAVTLSIASNIIFPIGVFMNERFIYVSSLGFCLILGQGIHLGLKHYIQHQREMKKAFLYSLSVLLFLYAGKTISRNRVWKNNFTLATHDANVSINGAKSNVMAGGLLVEEAQKAKNTAQKNKFLQKGIFHLRRAIEIYPEYIDALILMGNAQWELSHNAANALPYYRKILSINPNHTNAWQNIFIVLEQSKDVDYKLNAYETLLQNHPNKVKLYLQLGRTYGKEKNNLTKAIELFKQGLEVQPNNYDLLSNMGTVYGLQQNYTAAIEVLEKAVKLRPQVAKTHIDLGLSYFYLENMEKAKAHFDRAKELDPDIDRNQLPV